MTFPGRGAWTAVGKDNGKADYVYVAGKPTDGSTPAMSINYAAVTQAVVAIQKRINAMGYTPALTADGNLGPATDKGIRWFQSRDLLTVDGDIGPRTSKALWLPLLVQAEAAHALPGHHLFGIADHESLLDPGAVGATTPGDKGLMQWNTTFAGGITEAQAFDPAYAIPKAAGRLASSRVKFAGKGAVLQDACSIAEWNSPLWAQQWYAAAAPPNAQIKSYVDDVLVRAAGF